MVDYNDMGMVDPQGRFHSTDGLSHPDWAQEHRALVGFVGKKDSDFNPCTGDDAVYDGEGGTALDAFKWAGWIRVKPNQGVEVGSINEDNIDLIKKILRSIARANPGRWLYVDDGDGAKHVSVSIAGRPNFDEIERRVPQRRRYSR